MLEEKIRNTLALAIDNVSDLEKIEYLIKSTSEWIGVYKIGLEQFVRFGPSILEKIKKINRRIFLDLKFHDIPNTVAKAVESAIELETDFITLHIAGGSEMIKAAVNTKNKTSQNKKPALIGVTLLTSIDATQLESELQVKLPLKDYVLSMAGLATKFNLDGIVCSAVDLPYVKPNLPPNFIIVTPGIRLAENNTQDQKRVATPLEAIKRGSTLLVLGRIITDSSFPEKEAEKIFKELEIGL